MAKKRPYKRYGNKPGGKPNGKRGGGPPGGLQLRKLTSGEGWVVVPSREARERAEDLEEVRLMIDAGEFEVAVDELRWLLSGCPDLLAGHVLLGELAIEMHNDVPLARGHFGYAWQLGVTALQRNKITGPLPASQLANAPLHEAARGLAWCLEKLKMPHMANEVAGKVKQLDPADPLGVGAILDDLRAGGLPVIGLGE